MSKPWLRMFGAAALGVGAVVGCSDGLPGQVPAGQVPATSGLQVPTTSGLQVPGLQVPTTSGDLFLGCPEYDEERVLPELSNGLTTEAGTNHGSFTVSSTGDANFSLPIEVPPGRAGQVPATFVSYSSTSDDGYLGYGFSLGGLSAITRCPKNLLRDDEIASVRDDASDAFCMDGARLVKVAPNEFRTIPDTFSKIIANPSESNPQSFTVYTKSGLIQEYGTEDSGRVMAKKGVVRSWLISKSGDRNGNAILFKYLNERDPSDQHTIEFAPERIDYTDHPASPASRAIVFQYETRNPLDIQTLFARGMKLKRSLKLDKIETLGPNDSLVREYRFLYTTSPNTHRMLLTKIQECAADQACKPPTRFGYYQSQQGTGFDEFLTNLPGPQDNTGSLMMMDMTGDGLDDILISEKDPQAASGEDKTNWRLLPNLSQETTPAFFNAEALIFKQSHSVDPNTLAPYPFPEIATPIDMNHDGKLDLLYHDIRGEYPDWNVLLSNGVHSAKAIDTGLKRPFPQGAQPPAYLNANTQGSHLVDISGDGMPDMLHCELMNVHQWSVHLWTPQGFDSNPIPIPTLLQHPCDIPFVSVDIDADGQTEILVPEAIFSIGGLQFGTHYDQLSFKHLGQSWTRKASGLPIPPSGGRLIFIDANGDGLLDAVQSGFQDQQLRILYNTGAGFTQAFQALQNSFPEMDKFFGTAVAMDWNADGRQDLLLAMQNGLPEPEWRILQANGKVGSGAFDVVDPAVPLDVLLTSAGASIDDPYGPRVTDLNGDGVQDLVLNIAKHIRVFRNKLHGEEDRLHITTDGMNPWDESDPGFLPTVSIEYDHLIDRRITLDNNAVAASSTYIAQNGTAPGECAYPMHCVVGSKRVVSKYAVYQGGTKAHIYQVVYRNGRHHRLGGGFLGFGVKIVRDLDTGAGVASYFDNVTFDPLHKAFPFAGRVIQEHKWNPSLNKETVSVEMGFVSNWFDAVSTSGDLSYFVLNTFHTERRDQGSFLDTNPLMIEQYVRDTELSPAEVIAKTFRYVLDHDSFGNVLKERVATDDQSERTLVTREVENNTQDWLIGLLKKESKCSESNGVEQCRFFERTYDKYGKLKTEYSADAAESAPTQLFLTVKRDGFGNVILSTVKDASGQSRPSCITYDSEGIFPWATSNGENLVEYFLYDAGLGVLKTYEDHNGLVTKRRVDGFGRTVEEQRPDGITTSYAITRTKDGGPAFDQWNIKLETVTPGHQEETVQLDSMGRVVKTWTRRPQGTSLLPYPRVMRMMIYDELGERLITKSLPNNENTPIQNLLFDQYAYDGMGRLTKHIAPWGAVTGYKYSGRKVEITAPGGAVTLVENDQLGRPLFITDPELGITVYRYGPFQSLQSVMEPGGSITSFERDALGRVVELNDPDRGITHSAYNGFGELTHSEDALGRAVDLWYDRIGRLVYRNDSDGPTSWVYDQQPNGKGKLGELTSPAGHKNVYSYDKLGRPSKTEKIIDGESFAVKYTYDFDSRLQTLQYPGGYTLQHEYDLRGHLNRIKHGSETLWELKGSDSAGRISYEKLGAEVKTYYEYFEDRNRIKGILSQTQSQKIQDLAYVYDDRLNLTNRSDNQQGKTESFVYDQLDRVRDVCMTPGQWVQCLPFYEYDASGNLLSKLDVGSYVYEPARPHTLLSAGNEAYVHDAVGNLREKPGALIDYTAFDLPNHVSTPNDEYTYDYDGFQQRVRKRSLTKETVYIDRLYERVSDSLTGQVEHKYYVYSEQRLVAIHQESNIKGSEDLFVHADHLGSTDVITNSQGQIVDRQSFDAFGARRNPNWGAWPWQIGPPETTRGYTGHEGDDELGFINMQGRLMDPHIGRFITPDPVVANPAFGQHWNPFSYVANSPLNHSDPSGFNGQEVGVPMAPPIQNPLEGWPEGWTVTGYAVIPLPAGLDIDTSKLPVFDFENNIADYPIDLGIAGVVGGYTPQRSPAESELPKSGGQVALETGIGVAEGVGELLWEAGKFAVLNITTFGAYGSYKLWTGAIAGYQEDGILGVLNVVVPIGTIVKGTEGTLAAIADGDYRGAGRVGVQTLIIGITTAITLGEGAAALAGGKGTGAAAIANAENAGAKLAAKEGAALEGAAVPKGGTYKLVDRETGQVRRTGRTNNLDRRRLEHRQHSETEGLRFEVDKKTDSYPAQRGREQRLYDLHPEANLNRNQPIDPRNPNRDFYLNEGDKL